MAKKQMNLEALSKRRDVSYIYGCTKASDMWILIKTGLPSHYLNPSIKQQLKMVLLR